MKSICCVVFFCGLCEDACPKERRHLKNTSCFSYERRFHLWKDKLVMPLDIAMQNAQQKR
jgi:NADH-quinone oxidoreductase subunit I